MPQENKQLELLRGEVLDTLQNATGDSIRQMMNDAQLRGSEREYNIARWLLTLYYDYTRYQKRTAIEGWLHKRNPLEVMSVEVLDRMPDLPNDVLEATHEMINRGYQWLGVGYWSLAEQIYKSGLYLSISCNNVHAAIQCATNLALCYLGAKSYGDAYRASCHTYIIAVQADNRLITRLVTIELLSLISARQDKILQSRLQNLTSKVLDDKVIEDISNIYNYLGDIVELEALMGNWKSLRRLFS